MSTSTSALAKHVEAPLVLTTKTPRTLGFFDQFTLWGNLGISLFGPVTGALIAASTGSLAEGLAATVVGCVIGGLVLGGAAVFGSQTGAPAMACMRGLFGRQGSLAPTVLNIAQNIGWATMEIIVISQAAVAVTSERWRWLFVLLAGAIATTMAVRPLGSVRLLRKVMVWLVLLASAYLFFQVLKQPAHDLPQDQVLGFWPAVDLAAAGVVSFAPLAADYSRHSRTNRAAFAGASLGYGVAAAVYFALGVFAVARLQTNDADVIKALVTLPAGAIALFVLLVAVAIADFFVVSRRRWDVSATARFRWQPAVAWLCGFVAYQLVWPGTVKGWSDIWVDVQGWLHFTPPAWLGATYTSIIVGAVAAVLLGMTSQKAAQR